MKKLFILLLPFFTFAQSPTSSLDWVNVFIGTGGTGHTHPSASAPFGLIQLGPDTRYKDWEACSGYTDEDRTIFGFSHTHLSGTGVEDLCDILVVPQIGELKWNAQYLDKKGYGHTFQKHNEKASPGYYQVLLDNGIQASFTTMARSGIHQYHFPNGNEPKYLLIDLTHRDELLDHLIDVQSSGEISGFRRSKAWAKNQQIFFNMICSVQPMDIIYNEGKSKVALLFPSETEQVELSVGLSYTDANGAKNNRLQEIQNQSFNEIKSEVEQLWANELNAIQIKSTDTTALINFYTGLYHAYLCPNIHSDVDGRYREGNKIIQLPDGKNQYSTFSLWDTFRSTHPWYALFQKKRTVDFIETFERIFSERGDLPVWDLAGEETYCMIGFHAVSVIADAYVKGYEDIPVEHLINALVKTSNHTVFSRPQFNETGYLNYENENESVSKALEYAYDNFCIFNFLSKAKSEGFDVSDELISTYRTRSLHFVNHFNPESLFMEARRGGVWDKNFKPNAVMFHYTEGNSWQYSLFAPHAIGVLKKMLGGNDGLEKWLDNLFLADEELAGLHQVDITGLIGQYAHGNEPSHHVAYLYNYTNAPHKANEILHKIVTEFYHNDPDGLIGNEDCGQMSSWLNWTNLGIYPTTPGQTVYDFGLPQFEEVHIQIGRNPLTITKEQNNKEDIYTQKIFIDGKEWSKRYILHEELMIAQKIHFVMGPTPSNAYAALPHAPSISTLGEFSPLPFIKKGDLHFKKETVVELGVNFLEDHIIQYKFNNSIWKDYEGPFTIKKEGELFLKSYNKMTGKESAVISNQFKELDTTIHISFEQQPSPSYSADGYITLIDGQMGSFDHRNGQWLGWNDPAVKGTITFTSPKKMSEVIFNFLVTPGPWIFPPKAIRLSWYDHKGKKESLVEVPVQRFDKYEQNLSMDLRIRYHARFKWSAKKVKMVTFEIVNYGLLPDWHPGAGSKAWIFMDELIIR